MKCQLVRFAFRASIRKHIHYGHFPSPNGSGPPEGDHRRARQIGDRVTTVGKAQHGLYSTVRGVDAAAMRDFIVNG